MTTQADQKHRPADESVASPARQGGRQTDPPFVDQRPEAVAQRSLQQQVRGASLPENQRAPIQMSGGSSQANKELVRAMGKGAGLVDKLPKAKPHTKKGTGTSGTDHQGRNARVINKAKQDTKKAHNDPGMFSSSRMRGDARSKEKSAEANEKRREKKASTDNSMSDYDKAMEQARGKYQGNQEGFDDYLENRGFDFSSEQLDDLYAALYGEYE